MSSAQEEFNRALQADADARERAWVARGFVPKYNEVDPETETIQFGHELRAGMVVLADDPRLRHDLSSETISDATMYGMRQYNRWCVIREVYLCKHADGSSYIAFIGVYEDGVEMYHHHDVCMTWHVKKQMQKFPTFVVLTEMDLSDPKAGADKILNILREMGVSLQEDDPKESLATETGDPAKKGIDSDLQNPEDL
jgi:hypothetical protein